MGFTSALAFYKSLEQRSNLEFNYAYYKKIENGEKLPSVKIVHHLVGLLPQAYGEELILSFCQTQFPKQEHLFSSSAASVPKQTPKARPTKKKDQTVIAQQELTERQVSVIAQTEFHFYLFSLITLARRPLGKVELETFFSKEILKQALGDLAGVKLLYEKSGEIYSSYPEYRYPKAYSKSLQEAYKRLDQFDLSKIEFFQLKKQTRAHFFRRISPRYLDLILNSIELLYQTIRLSDDFDSRENNVVCSLNIRLDSGELPG